MITTLTIRVGDFFLFLLSGFVISLRGLLNRALFVMRPPPLLILLIAFTKKAQLPFSGWLPKAIRAPTPTSALVHSSTLVTAGWVIVSIIKPTTRIIFSSRLCIYVGLTTLITGKFLAMLEPRIKKVVAYKTLSHIGVVGLLLGGGYFILGWLHIIVHGLAKRLLFICVGYFIHIRGGQQDSRKWRDTKTISNLILIQSFISLRSLCGILYLRGIVKKELILRC
jgi:NADH-ubiquinone oxidoreductase chain 5